MTAVDLTDDDLNWLADKIAWSGDPIDQMTPEIMAALRAARAVALHHDGAGKQCELCRSLRDLAARIRQERG